jgi:ferredoxin--NADP+ reductase
VSDLSTSISVAIVGSGPSGFYAAEALLKAPSVSVSMIDRLPTPFGLVRGGVAPDHPKIKTVTVVYDKIARSPNFVFFGHVDVGKDISISELLQTHHAVVVACGAESDHRLDVPGEDIAGSYAASAFVGWYNGHPSCRLLNFDLSGTSAVIVGQGNVAADVARILLTSPDILAKTDIASHALCALRGSSIKEVHLIGRRGPAQASFTPTELTELGKIEGCAVEVRDDLKLNPASAEELLGRRGESAARNVSLFRKYKTEFDESAPKRLVVHFNRSPVALTGENRLQAVMLEKTRLEGLAFSQKAVGTGHSIDLKCDVLFRSIGAKGVAIPGLPFDQKKGVIPNLGGRVRLNDRHAERLYVVGWIKRGAKGIIGTNRADSIETVSAMLQDRTALEQLGERPGANGTLRLLNARGTHFTTYSDWDEIDRYEIERGQSACKPREKLTVVSAMLDLLQIRRMGF